MQKIKVFLVDDSKAMLAIQRKFLSATEDMEVCGTASEGHEAVEKILAISPDVVVLDINIPGMNGVDVIRQLVRTKPVPILVCSSFTNEGARISNQALMEGAVECMFKPASASELEKMGPECVKKLRIVSHVKVIRRIDIRPQTRSKSGSANLQKSGKVIVIGSSTGGPMTLLKFFNALPDSVSAPILIAQHMPEKFTTILAEELDSVSHYKVTEARNGDDIMENRVLIGQGGHDMLVTMDGKILIGTYSEEAHPSVDVLFETAAAAFGNKTVGIILTGMGSDGTKGASRIKDGGGLILAESVDTAILPSMPSSIINSGFSDFSAPAEEIAGSIKRFL